MAFEGFLLPAVEGLVAADEGLGKVEEVEFLTLVLGLPTLDSLLPLRGREEEAWSWSPLLRKESSCGIMADPRSLPPLLSRETNWVIISRLSGSLMSLSLETMASWSLLMNSLSSFSCFRTFSSSCGSNFVSVSEASNCRFFCDRSTHLLPKSTKFLVHTIYVYVRSDDGKIAIAAAVKF